LNIQTSDKNHFTEGIIYASKTTKIIDENHALQQAFLNELDEKLWALPISSANNLMPLTINISFLVLSS
jgi:type I modification enzyme